MLALEDIRSSFSRVASAYPVRRAYLFGSQARREAGEDSDVDIMVDTDAGFSLFDLCGLKNELEGFLGSRVDIVTRAGAKDYVRESAEVDEVLIYEAA